MGAAHDLDLLSLTHLQKLALSQEQQQRLNPNSSTAASGSSLWMWNPNQGLGGHGEEEEESWEVRAFAEDTGNIMGTTWPPRSYTCTFCRREFRSAQALGGHMNVHRRDRARLHHSPAAITTTSSSPGLVFPGQEFVKNGGLCFFYSLPGQNPNASIPSSTLLSTSPYPQHNLVHPNYPPYVNFPLAPPSVNSCHSSNTDVEPSASIEYENHNNNNNNDNNHNDKDSAVEELDLELRLGCRPSS